MREILKGQINTWLYGAVQLADTNITYQLTTAYRNVGVVCVDFDKCSACMNTKNSLNRKLNRSVIVSLKLSHWC